MASRPVPHDERGNVADPARASETGTSRELALSESQASARPGRVGGLECGTEQTELTERTLAEFHDERPPEFRDLAAQTHGDSRDCQSSNSPPGNGDASISQHRNGGASHPASPSGGTSSDSILNSNAGHRESATGGSMKSSPTPVAAGSSSSPRALSLIGNLGNLSVGREPSSSALDPLAEGDEDSRARHFPHSPSRARADRPSAGGSSAGLPKLGGMSSKSPSVLNPPSPIKRLPEPLSTPPPSQPDGYVVERCLGHGSYGSVWLALQKSTGKRVAIKFFHRSGRLDLNLMRREVEKLAALYTDRDIVQLIDVGWEKDPPYFVMEYVPGGSLEELVRSKGPLPVPEAVRLVRETAQALLHAHGRGVLHCDLKPANVLLDADRKVRLADFGQSRLLDEAHGSLGTFFYMAPEQADTNATPDARWDVYALGAMLYCLLTGAPPHRAELTDKGRLDAPDLQTRLKRYRDWILQRPRPVAHRSVPGIDGSLVDILDRCLEPRPHRRFPNVQSVLTALEAREARQARRPLILMGAVGPAVLTTLLSIVATWAFEVSIRESNEALINRALESNRFAAQFASETVVREISRRMTMLERVADHPELPQLVVDASAEVQAGIALNRAPPTQPRDPANPWRTQLQNWIEKAHRTNSNVQVHSWFVTDAFGNQLARSPFSAESVGKNFSGRDYFHGLGRDQSPDSGSQPVNPVDHPHVSGVYRSVASQKLLVAFSVPIRSNPEHVAGSQVVGLLSVTVELGGFAELRTDDSGRTAETVVLVDTRPNCSGEPGVILQHPTLAGGLRGLAGGAAARPYRISSTLLGKLDRLQNAVRSSPGRRPPAELAVDNAYIDPADPDAGTQLAAFEPVFAGDRYTGWCVIVQESIEHVTEPVRRLRQKLLILGYIALFLGVSVLTGAWLWVIRTLNRTTPGWIHSRRSGGSTGSASGSSWAGLSLLGWLGGRVSAASASPNNTATSGTALGPVGSANISGTALSANNAANQSGTADPVGCDASSHGSRATSSNTAHTGSAGSSSSTADSGANASTNASANASTNASANASTK